MLPLRAHHRLANQDPRAGHGFVRFEALRHLLRERHLERVSLDRRAVGPARWSDGSELPRMLARGRSRESAGADGCVACAVCGEPAVGRESPGAVEQYAYADAFTLGIGEALDPPVLRRDELVPLHHDACIRILGPRSSRRIHCGCTEIAHARHSNQAARTTRPAHGYNAPAFKRWWRNW